MLAVLLLAMTSEDGATKSNLQPIYDSAELSIFVYSSDCKDQFGTIGMALRQLSSGNYDEIQQARHTLVNFARQSNTCRQEVVRALIKAMDKPNLDFERQPANYYLWREGSQLLGELKATEALDLLISHLDMTNGFHSASMVFQPAIMGLRQMGPAAVSKLIVVLQQSPKASIRMAAAYCLTIIGGEAAMKALRQALDGESNPCVANFITVSLNTFTYKSKSGISFDNEAPQANTEVRQSWLMAFQCVE
jgi:HEAT repeat protein